ncbi:PDZ domain-containing protein [Shewanella marina]|uniref:PDZ domain-containing protein n=1 Tax=Shewanella marina TaxID=487319 RepID=UPI000A859AE9|nr:PDZ domain-containing protein [Shewanella marina]
MLGAKYHKLVYGFGAKFKAAPLGVQIVSVNHGSPAHYAGLSAGDILIAVDNLQATMQLEKQLEHYQLGDLLNLHWFRRDILMQGQLQINAAELDTIQLALTDELKAKAWLHQ